LALLFVLMLFASLAELVSIGSVLPFLGVLTAPNHIFGHPSAQPFIHALGIVRADQLLLPLSIAFALSAIAAGAMRLLLLWATSRLAQAIGADLSFDIYRRTLYQPYAVHVARNSSEVISGITSKAGGVTNTLMALLTLAGSAVMLVTVLVALTAVNTTIALIAFGGFGLAYAAIVRATRSSLIRNSQRIAHESTQVIKCLQEGLGGIRDVLIDGTQATYCQIYRNADLPLRRAHGSIAFVSGGPRYAMEVLGMLLITFLAFSLAQQADGIAKAIPILGAFALGAQRLLPAMQQAYAAWSSIQGGLASLQDTLDLLEQPLPRSANEPITERMEFKREIVANRISFRYSAQTAWVLKDVSFSIAKGSRVGFVGTTGSGKSTLLDIIMDLLQPTEGSIEVDGRPLSAGNQRAWQAHIAHVPQAIFLADSTIEENIAFGIPKDQIDSERVRQVASQAQIAASIEAWPNQYQTLVGERGIRLSGGQRQRIGIARALYKNADVIIFDEATSALDSETELSVMQSIEGLSEELTILIIAHRVTTLKNCTRIVELGDGGIRRIGTYHDMAIQSA
jgi:ATP-binding cassette subfamily B protein